MIKWFIAFALAIVAVGPLAYFSYKYLEVQHQQTVPPAEIVGMQSPYEAIIDYIPNVQDKPMEPDSEFLAKCCQVVDGFRFSILLENDQWIEARLNVVTTTNATEKVIEILKMSPPPTVVLKRKIDGYWVVDIRLTVNREQVMISTMLRERKLVL